MLLVAAGNNRRNRKNSGSVSGGKAAAFKRRFTTIKEGMVKRRSSRHIARPLSARDGFDHQINHCAVGISKALANRLIENLDAVF